MAFMTQAHKGRIASLLKDVIPKTWKYSLAVRHHSTIVLTIAAAPVDLLAQIREVHAERHPAGEHHVEIKDYVDFNTYYPENYLKDEMLDLFKKIIVALNLNNWDKSDPMTDHFNVGHYIAIHIGRWNKPFVVLPNARR